MSSRRIKITTIGSLQFWRFGLLARIRELSRVQLEVHVLHCPTGLAALGVSVVSCHPAGVWRTPMRLSRAHCVWSPLTSQTWPVNFAPADTACACGAGTASEKMQPSKVCLPAVQTVGQCTRRKESGWTPLTLTSKNSSEAS